MKFEQIDRLLENALTELNWTGYRPEQQHIITKIKQGGNFVIRGQRNSGFTTLLQLISILKAPGSFEGSPRVLWITSTPERAEKIVNDLMTWVRRTEIAIEIAYDKGNMILQRNMIFDGAEIIVGNPKRLLDLYNQNGYHVGQLNLLLIDDCSEICKDPIQLQRVRRISESITKCQKVVATYGDHERFAQFVEEVCGFHEELNYP